MPLNQSPPILSSGDKMALDDGKNPNLGGTGSHEKENGRVSNSTINELEKELGVEANNGNGIKAVNGIYNYYKYTTAVPDGDGNVREVAQGKANEGQDDVKDIDYILSEIKQLRDKLENKADKNNSEDEEANRYPQDCYTLIALNGPMENNMKWDKEKILYFSIGVMVFTLQFFFLVLTIMSRVDPSIGDVGTSNPGIDDENWENSIAWWMTRFVDTNEGSILLTSQFLSLLVYILFPDSSLEDVVLALQYFPRFSRAEDGDPVWSMAMSCVLRGCQGILASIAVFLVVLTSDTVLDIFLNFAALNFISNLDDHFFSLADSGVFGPGLQKETKRIENMQLPDCMARKCPCFCYKMVMGCFTLVFFPLLIFVTSCQASPDTWLTQHLRVEYTEKEFRIYSGCYNLTDELTKWGKRYTYSSFGGPRSTSIGYCVEDSDWVVFEGDSSRDPCDVKESGDGLVAYSAETNDFDVSSTFGIPWWDFSGSPLDLFFETDELETHCDLRILDGMCDPEFNEPGFLYDGGDCCAATCVGSNCGKGQLQSVFGNSNATGDGFPDCANPEMVSVTIQINELTSSRKDVDTTMWFFNNDESLWRNEIPPPLYFSIECNGKLALIVYIEESMVNKSETIKIEDGSSCQIVVKNETDTIDPAETWLKDFPHIKGSDGNASPDPIWYVDYTIFFELDDSIGDGSVEVLSAKSKQDGIVNFTLLPKCFFEELEDQIDTSTFYNTKALEWLAQDDPEISNCGEIEFLERYALLQIDLGFNGTVVEFANRQTHCSWPSIDCDEGMVDALSLKGEGLNGEIRSELGLLTHLKELDISYNNIESIPSEIALLTNLQELRADKIRVNEIPSEIGHLTQLRGLSWHDSGLTELPPEMFLLTILEWFSFYNNEITEVPSEIGRLTRMHYLSVFGNNISKLATDIWQLTDLRFLDFHGNSLGEIPSQIGLLTNLEFCNFDSNGLTELPSEIWSLTTLSRVMWRDNEITELQSNGIKLLTNLERLMLQHNQIAEIPSEIGLLTKLTTLYLHNNQLTSLPTEIGLLTNLQWLFLGENMFTDLPSEIGLLTNVAELNIAGNNFTCDDIMVADGVPCFEEYNYGLS